MSLIHRFMMKLSLLKTMMLSIQENLSAKRGCSCGYFFGAAVFAAIELAKREENRGKNMLVLLLIQAARYLSTSLFQSENETYISPVLEISLIYLL